MIKTLSLLILLTTTNLALATPNEPRVNLTRNDLCSQIAIEIMKAEELGYINKQEAEQLIRNCYK